MNALRNKLPLVARTLLGLVFVVFGLNGFLNFIPAPPPEGAAGAFGAALFATGYMFPLIKGTEVVAGVLLLSGRFVPLALTLLAPILVNILGFHGILARSGVGMPVVLVALEIYLAWAYRDSFAPMLRANAKPVAAEPSSDRAPAVARA